MSKNPILNNFVSEADEFLAKIRHDFPNLSNSQIKEQNKYAAIYEKRDKPIATSPANASSIDFLNSKEV